MRKTKDMISDDDRNDTVAELYALRAGLSVISQLADDIRDSESKIKDVRSRVEPINEEINRKNRSIFQMNSQIAFHENSISEIQSREYGTARSYGSYLWDEMRGVNLKWVIFSILFIVIGVVFLILTFTLFEALIGFACLSFLFGIPMSAIFILGSFLTARKNRKNVLNGIQEAIERNKTTIVEKQDQIKELKEKIAVIEEEKNKLYGEREEIKKNIERDVAEIEGKIEAITQQARLYRKALETQYGRLLNPADWHNIDLCIFYLQTGRADTIKECLLLADRQRQNDEIVGTIQAASDRISGEIRGGFAALGSTMVTCINALSTQIESVSSTMLAQQHDTIRALGAIENSNQALLSSAQINNALQAKANETSEALLRDYRYVQEQSGFTVY